MTISGCRTMERLLFTFGRLHPMLVHLPIGFIVLSLIFEVLIRFRRFGRLRSAIPIMALLSFITLCTATISGLLIAMEGGYDEHVLNAHLYFGIGSLILSAIATWILCKRYLESRKFTELFLQVMLFVLMAISGHLGGFLTHGKDFILPHDMPGHTHMASGDEKGESRNGSF